MTLVLRLNPDSDGPPVGPLLRGWGLLRSNRRPARPLEDEDDGEAEEEEEEEEEGRAEEEEPDGCRPHEEDGGASSVGWRQSWGAPVFCTP